MLVFTSRVVRLNRRPVYMEGFELTSYLSNGVDRMIRDMLKVSLKYPQQSLFIMHYAAAQKKPGH